MRERAHAAAGAGNGSVWAPAVAQPGRRGCDALAAINRVPLTSTKLRPWEKGALPVAREARPGAAWMGASGTR